MGINSFCLPTVLLLFFLHISSFPATILATNFAEQTEDGMSSFRLESVANYPWLEKNNENNFSDKSTLLSRVRRAANGTSGSRSVWQKIEDFYADKNNMAMFCVLPILILVYGGCSSVYCIYKCRLYVKRRKHKRLKEEDCDSLNATKANIHSESSEHLNGNKNRPVSQISNAWTELQVDTGENRWSGFAEIKQPSPLPWHVPNINETPVPATQVGARENMSRAAYVDDRLRNEDMIIKARNKESVSESDRRAGDEDYPDGNADVVWDSHSIQKGIKRVPAAVKATDRKSYERTRIHANLADYTINSFSTLKAADYSRFSDSRPLEIIPLTADPNLRVWDPLHNRPAGETWQSGVHSGVHSGIAGLEGSPGGRGTITIKKDMLTRFDVLATIQMARKAAEILNSGAMNKNKSQRRQAKKKHIFIAE